ncbi:hypothetical protein [Frigidibacter sp. ROC022]|uniref:hypothetical protein n=1 Tax=Frigidibacter sp. ROC022 TaxID=2971796 RepID=UPI00215A9CFD|nr:hypothetical protein [Frigidibacter sp. ROC022]MCR8724048.1 hypothetical protein [Frigidibacter sp. ROC022]
MSGYSGTPLARKLGLKEGLAVAFAGLPEGLDDLTRAAAFRDLQTVPDWRGIEGAGLDYIHLFTDSAAELDAATPALRARMAPGGSFWVSWPKRASKVETDVTEDVIRARALSDILVDVKVCAVDEVWSGLKLMIRKHLRDEHAKGL